VRANPPGEGSRPGLLRPAVLAGPLLMVAGVLVVLHGFVFGKLSSQHPDILAYWLPTYCFLGKALAAGHIPAWNPHVMGGLPFAADPQSGWMYLPAMALFTALPCGAAMRWMIVLQPLVGGLGLYGFLRSEGLSRPGSTVGGLSLALGVSASRLVLFLPFPSAFAWTAVLLAASSRFVHASRRSRRVLWALATAAAWGQLAASHTGHGLILGTGALVAYLAANAVSTLRRGGVPVRDVVLRAVALLPAFALVNMAFFLPRLAYLPQSSYGVGYSKLPQLTSYGAGWPLKLATSPGAELGAVVLALSFAAFWSRRHRALAVGFGAFGLGGYVLALAPVVRVLGPRVRSIPVLNFYQHYPGRFDLALFVAIPVLGAIGLDAWFERPRSGRERALMAAPGLVVFLLLPIALGAGPRSLVLFWLGLAAAAVLLWLAARRPALVALVPVVLLFELGANGLAGQSASPLGGGPAIVRDPFGAALTGWTVPLRAPDVDAAAYLRPDAIAAALQRAGDVRYLSFDPQIAGPRGYLARQAPADWPLTTNQRATLFGLQDVQGYNPFQLARYWTYLRTLSPEPLDYNAAVFRAPAPTAWDLLQAGFVVARTGRAPEAGDRPVAADGAWTLYRRPVVVARAQVLTNWLLAGSPDEALGLVTASGFDPTREVVLEADPGITRSNRPAGAGAASLRTLGPQAARIEVSSAAPAVVLVRIPFGSGWRATVDGRAATVHRADYLLQSVVVPAGHHVIELRYADPWIGWGVAGTAVVVACFLLASALLSRRERA